MGLLILDEVRSGETALFTARTLTNLVMRHADVLVNVLLLTTQVELAHYHVMIASPAEHLPDRAKVKNLKRYE